MYLSHSGNYFKELKQIKYACNSYWGYQQSSPCPIITDFLDTSVKLSLLLEHVNHKSCNLKSIFREIYFFQNVNLISKSLKKI